jgi:hypothetical protein
MSEKVWVAEMKTSTRTEGLFDKSFDTTVAIAKIMLNEYRDKRYPAEEFTLRVYRRDRPEEK